VVEQCDRDVTDMEKKMNVGVFAKSILQIFDEVKAYGIACETADKLKEDKRSDQG